MILALSLGNTNLRHAVFDGADIRERGVVPLADRRAVLASLSRLLESAPGVDGAVLASVRPDRLALVEEALQAGGLTPQVAGRDFTVPLENHCRPPEAVGIDRLLGILAASELFPGEGVVVVDFGTAVTINVGSPRGEFLGGLIGIGASTAAAALSEHAPLLPRVQLELPSGVVATETRQAINDGIFWEVRGGVERILAELRRQLPWPLRGVATGGDAALLAPRIDGLERVEPDLVLRGLRICHGGARK